jgi:hypothetical protein
MLKDEEFSRNASVDRYGRKLRKDDTKKQLEQFYRFDEDDKEQDVSADEDEVVQKELRRVEKGSYDPAREGGFSSSSSESSSEEESEEELEGDVEELEFPNKARDDVPVGEATHRIAVVNLDWDHIRAEDLMAVISSFLPPGGRMLKVSIYPSEFGRERMEREEMEGPPKGLFAKRKADELDDAMDGENEDDEEEEERIKRSILREDAGEDFDSAQLRKYQLERLRYFYAVTTFSSKDVARHVYDAVDGAEYMSSANFFDLRFVPDDTDFTGDIPRDECDRMPDGYRPTEFVTDALQHSKVKLTWDADDPSRKDAQARAFKGGRREIEENDLKAYLGSDSSEAEDDDEIAGDATADGKPKLSKKEAERAKLRALLGLPDKPLSKPDKKAPVGDMEVTFSAGLTAAPTRESVFENEPEKDETTKEKYIRKERERRKRRKEKMKSARKGESVPTAGEDKQESDAAVQEEEDRGFDDPFFTTPEVDAAAAAKQRKEERRKLREQREADEAASAARRAELELLMVDDKASTVRHFDMNEIEKAEKLARKKHKKAKLAKADLQQDDFKVDVKDPRFQSLFESHEYALDPTNPRFKNTQGMRTLLEEGRKRRQHEDAEPAAKKRKASKPDAADSEDLSKLVERVKGKIKKK